MYPFKRQSFTQFRPSSAPLVCLRRRAFAARLLRVFALGGACVGVKFSPALLATPFITGAILNRLCVRLMFDRPCNRLLLLASAAGATLLLQLPLEIPCVLDVDDVLASLLTGLYGDETAGRYLASSMPRSK